MGLRERAHPGDRVKVLLIVAATFAFLNIAHRFVTAGDVMGMVNLVCLVIAVALLSTDDR